MRATEHRPRNPHIRRLAPVPRGRRPGACDGELVARWEELLAGRWSIVQTSARSGQLRFVAAANPAARDELRALSARERRVIGAVARGQSNKAIAIDLGLGESSLATIFGRALRKLGVSRREHLSRLAAALEAAPPVATTRARTQVLHVSLGDVPGLLIELDADVGCDRLTASERVIATLVLSGHTAAEIAARRGRSYRTIANQLAAIYRKFVVNSRAELVAHLSGVGGA